MIASSIKPFKQNGQEVVFVTSDSWSEFRDLVSFAHHYHNEGTISVLRERPLFKKGGSDHIRVNIAHPQGIAFLEAISVDPWNRVTVEPKTMEVVNYQLKIERLKAQGEWNKEIESYMESGLRSRVVAMLKAGEWMDEPSNKSVSFWQIHIRGIDLGRNAGLEFAPKIQNQKYMRKTKKMEILLAPTENELFAEALINGSFKNFLEAFPEQDHKMRVVKWKQEQGIIPVGDGFKFLIGPIEDLF